ncbi:MAG: CopG family transcriptional regulator [Actinomycetota bacterium]
MAMDKRVEVLFPRDLYENLKAEARRRGVSFGELVRDSMRRVYERPSEERRRRAVEFLTSPAPVDVGPWEEAKKLIGRWVEREPDA